jgi:sulfide:quinone oxidoreductase
MKKLLILGAGSGGVMTAAHVSKRLDPKEWQITIIDRSTDK